MEHSCPDCLTPKLEVVACLNGRTYMSCHKCNRIYQLKGTVQSGIYFVRSSTLRLVKPKGKG